VGSTLCRREGARKETPPPENGKTERTPFAEMHFLPLPSLGRARSQAATEKKMFSWDGKGGTPPPSPDWTFADAIQQKMWGVERGRERGSHIRIKQGGGEDFFVRDGLAPLAAGKRKSEGAIRKKGGGGQTLSWKKKKGRGEKVLIVCGVTTNSPSSGWEEKKRGPCNDHENVRGGCYLELRRGESWLCK